MTSGWRRRVLHEAAKGIEAAQGRVIEWPSKHERGLVVKIMTATYGFAWWSYSPFATGETGEPDDSFPANTTFDKVRTDSD